MSERIRRRLELRRSSAASPHRNKTRFHKASRHDWKGLVDDMEGLVMSRKYWEWQKADWRYQLVPNGEGLMLWFLMPGTTVWEIGHSVPVRKGLSEPEVAEIVRRFIFGEIESCEYRGLVGLPHLYCCSLKV